MSESNHPDLLSLANRLGELYQSKRGAQIELAHQEADLEGNILRLTPDDGWPGKNEENRRLARERALADDQACRNIAARMTELRDDLADLEAEIDALDAERRAREWMIRQQLVEALMVRAVQQNHKDGDRAEQAFDDAADGAAMETALDALPF